jgi:hypothetical protein
VLSIFSLAFKPESDLKTLTKYLFESIAYQNSPSATLDSLSRSSMGTSSHSAESRLQAPTYSLPTPVGLRSRTSWTFSPLNVSTWNRKRRNYKLVVARSKVIAARKVDSFHSTVARLETLLSCVITGHIGGTLVQRRGYCVCHREIFCFTRAAAIRRRTFEKIVQTPETADLS